MACGPAAAHPPLPEGYFRKSAYPGRQASQAQEGTANSSLQPLKIPLGKGKGKHGVGTGICLPTEPGIILRATPSLHLIYPPGMPRARGRDSPLPHPPAPSGRK